RGASPPGACGRWGPTGFSFPPSLPLILYGIVAEQSVPRLFLAGILPGLLQAVAFFVWVLYVARRSNFPVEPVRPLRERLRVTLSALPALLVPLVVMVGIYGGFVTVTEAAALSAGAAPRGSPLFYPRLPLRPTPVGVAAWPPRPAPRRALIR